MIDKRIPDMPQQEFDGSACEGAGFICASIGGALTARAYELGQYAKTASNEEDKKKYEQLSRDAYAKADFYFNEADLAEGKDEKACTRAYVEHTLYLQELRKQNNGVHIDRRQIKLDT